MLKREELIGSDHIYKDLLERIISLELEPGQLISEHNVCKHYGVSRTIVRKAFSQLEQLKFIEVFPQRGSYVSHIDLDYIADLLFLRTAVEKEVLFEVFYKLSPEARHELYLKLEKNLEEQERCRDERDYFGDFPKLDAEFHKTIIDSVQRYGLFLVLNEYMLHIARWRNFDVVFENRIPRLIKEHWSIAEAIRDGNLALAQRNIGIHLDTISGIVDSATSKFADYFYYKSHKGLPH